MMTFSKMILFATFIFLPIATIANETFLLEDDHGNPKLSDIIQAPLKYIGETKATIFDRMGKPEKIESSTFPNQHDPSIINRRDHLEYSGLQIQVLETGFGKELIEKVILETDIHELTGNIRMGNTRDQVKAIFPIPYRENKEQLKYWYEYPIGPDIIIFHFRDEKLVKIVWDYIID